MLTSTVRRDTSFEDEVREYIWRFHARRLRDIAVELGMPSPSSRVPKQFGHQVVARIIDSGPASISILDFEKRGITVKTARIPPDVALPYESTSFPAFDHMDLGREEWETSTLRRQLAYMFFATLIGRDKSTPLPECTFDDGSFWTPSKLEWSKIHADWEEYRRRIKAGRASDLPTETETQAIHVRPHGRDALDLDDAPGPGAVTKKSFWLNRGFVQELIVRARSS